MNKQQNSDGKGFVSGSSAYPMLPAVYEVAGNEGDSPRNVARLLRYEVANLLAIKNSDIYSGYGVYDKDGVPILENDEVFFLEEWCRIIQKNDKTWDGKTFKRLAIVREEDESFRWLTPFTAERCEVLIDNDVDFESDR